MPLALAPGPRRLQLGHLQNRSHAAIGSLLIPRAVELFPLLRPPEALRPWTLQELASLTRASSNVVVQPRDSRIAGQQSERAAGRQEAPKEMPGRNPVRPSMPIKVVPAAPHFLSAVRLPPAL